MFLDLRNRDGRGPEEKLAEEKRLYRSRTNRVFFGVCGGLAEYLSIDVTLIRLVTVLISIWGGVGVVAYLVAALIIPEEPEGVKKDKEASMSAKKEDLGKKMESAAQDIKRNFDVKSKEDKSWIGGLVLIALGLLFLAHQFVPFLDFQKMWPLFLIILGLIIIFGGKRG